MPLENVRLTAVRVLERERASGGKKVCRAGSAVFAEMSKRKARRCLGTVERDKAAKHERLPE